MQDKDIQYEQNFFYYVVDIIAKKLDVLLQKKTVLKDDVISARADMWEENRHIIRDFDDVILLSTQDRDVAAIETQYNRNATEIQRLTKMMDSPYFGRIDFTSKDNEGKQSIYIGIYSLNKVDSSELCIIDWRAPIASLYYNFDLGPAWYKLAEMQCNVNILLKRQFRIENGVLKALYDTNSAMYDEILGNILSQRANNNLKVIISSIQKEQNIAIRTNTTQPCLIYGLAGSGKTSVGLHRIAYILYHHRQSMKADNILIISKNSIFSSYISHILPDLGEEAAHNVVYSTIISNILGRKYKIEDYYEQQQIISIPGDSDRTRNICIKYSLEFLDYCKNYFQNFYFKIPVVKYKGNVIISPDSFQKKWGYRKFSSFKAKYNAVIDMIQKSITDYFEVNKEEVYADIKNNCASFITNNEVAVLYKKKIKKYIMAVRDRFDSINRLTAEDQLVNVMTSYLMQHGLQLDECKRMKTALNNCDLLFEDANLFVYVKLLMGEITPFPKIQHIVIDEAQDYGVIQLYIIKLLFPNSNFTLLADVYQAVNSVTTMHEYEMFDSVFGTEINKIRLDQCYRSSKEINALSFQLIHDDNKQIQHYSFFDRSVKLPEYIISNNPIASIGTILRNLGEYNTTAIITNDERDAVWIGSQFPLTYNIHLIVTPSEALGPGINVLPLMLAKGLEFDVVILLYPCSSDMNGDCDLRRLYLGCTRALHELYIVERDAPPTTANWLPYIRIRKGSEIDEEDSTS